MKHRDAPASPPLLIPRSSPASFPRAISSDSPLGITVPSRPPSAPLSSSRSPLGVPVAYKLTAGTDSAVSTVFHVIRSRIIYLTTLGARSRNFYCFVTPGGVDGPGAEDARKLDCDVNAVVLHDAVLRAHPFGIHGHTRRPRGRRGCC